MRRIIILFISLFLITSCVTRLHRVKTDEQILETQGYIAGSFKHSKFILFRLFFGSPFVVVLQDIETNQKYLFNFNFSAKEVIHAIPPGTYTILSVEKYITTKDREDRISASVLRIPIPDVLHFNFIVKPGKVTYIGSLIVEDHFVLKYLNRVDHYFYFKEGKKNIMEQYPALNSDDIISFRENMPETQ